IRRSRLAPLSSRTSRRINQTSLADAIWSLAVGAVYDRPFYARKFEVSRIEAKTGGYRPPSQPDEHDETLTGFWPTPRMKAWRRVYRSGRASGTLRTRRCIFSFRYATTSVFYVEDD